MEPYHESLSDANDHLIFVLKQFDQPVTLRVVKRETVDSLAMPNLREATTGTVSACPFCGIEPEIRKGHDKKLNLVNMVYHQGGKCCILGGMWFDIKKWNTRNIPDGVMAELDELLYHISTVFDGWHSDGAHRNKWDESVRTRLSEFRKKYTYSS